MKQTFSTKWTASKQPRKQRKYSYNAPLHLRHKKLAATLSKELRKKHGCRNIEVRKGDTVKIMRGKFKGKQGKVLACDLVKQKISIDGIQATKLEGSKVAIWFDTSNIKIILIDLDDKMRMKRKKKVEVEEKAGKEEKKTESKSKEEKDASKKN